MRHAESALKRIDPAKNHIGSIELDRFPYPLHFPEPYQLHHTCFIHKVRYEATSPLLGNFSQGRYSPNDLNFQRSVAQLCDLVESRAIDVSIREQVGEVSTGVDSEFLLEKLPPCRAYALEIRYGCLKLNAAGVKILLLYLL